MRQVLVGSVLVLGGAASAQEIDYFMRPIGAPANDTSSVSGIAEARTGMGLETRARGGYVGEDGRIGMQLQAQQSFGVERAPFVGVLLSGALRQSESGSSGMDWGATGYFGLVPLEWTIANALKLEGGVIASFTIDNGFIPALGARAKLLGAGETPWNLQARVEPRVVGDTFGFGAELSGGVGRNFGGNLIGLSLTASLDTVDSATLRPFGAGLGAELSFQRSAIKAGLGVNMPYSNWQPSFGLSLAYAL